MLLDPAQNALNDILVTFMEGIMNQSTRNAIFQVSMGVLWVVLLFICTVLTIMSGYSVYSWLISEFNAPFIVGVIGFLSIGSAVLAITLTIGLSVFGVIGYILHNKVLRLSNRTRYTVRGKAK